MWVSVIASHLVTVVADCVFFLLCVGWYSPECPDSAGYSCVCTGVVDDVTFAIADSVYLPDVLFFA